MTVRAGGSQFLGCSSFVAGMSFLFVYVEADEPVRIFVRGLCIVPRLT